MFRVAVFASIILSCDAFAPCSLGRSTTRLWARRCTPSALVDPFAGTAAAALLASSPMDVSKLNSVPTQSIPMTIAVKEIRQGIYGEYEVEVKPQQYDDARGTFKTVKETKKGKNKYVAVLGVLLIGSFIIPMLQYFWYVRED